MPVSTADEVFLTSTTRDVQALERVDDRSLQPGPVAEKISNAFEQVLRSEIDP